MRRSPVSIKLRFPSTFDGKSTNAAPLKSNLFVFLHSSNIWMHGNIF